jgi:hypothetical protein
MERSISYVKVKNDQIGETLAQLVGDPLSFRSARQKGDTVVSAKLSADCRNFAERHTWSRRAEAFSQAIGLGQFLTPPPPLSLGLGP